MEVVLVDTVVFQNYIINCIKNLLLHGNKNITVIIDKNLEKNLSELENSINIVHTENLDVEKFDVKNKLDKKFWSGFWKNTSKRHFYLYSYMKKYDRKNVIHIENDIMVYANLNEVFQNYDKSKTLVTMHNPNLGIPGIIYIPEHIKYEKFITNHLHDKDDMINISHFYNNNREICDTFPTIKENEVQKVNEMHTKNFNTFNCIFDGASIGQYLGGVDPRICNNDVKSYINPSCDINYSLYKFFWVKDNNELYAPYIKIGDEIVKIVNLHIHCKSLADFMSDNPKENECIKKWI
jgi:hypothetical protein